MTASLSVPSKDDGDALKKKCVVQHAQVCRMSALVFLQLLNAATTMKKEGLGGQCSGYTFEGQRRHVQSPDSQSGIKTPLKNAAGLNNDFFSDMYK